MLSAANGDSERLIECGHRVNRSSHKDKKSQQGAPPLPTSGAAFRCLSPTCTTHRLSVKQAGCLADLAIGKVGDDLRDKLDDLCMRMRGGQHGEVLCRGECSGGNWCSQ